MISLDIDLSYLSNFLNIGTQYIQRYRNNTITEIFEMEAEKGNSRAAEYLLRITSDPEALAKIFQLVNPKNRYLILRNMNEEDLMKVMEKLETEQFILGLSMLKQDALVDLMMFLPPESLAAVVLEKMDPNMFMNLIPDKFLDEFLLSDKLDRKLIMKALEDVDEEQLQKMMEHFSGQTCYDTRDNILQQMSKLSDDNFLRAITSCETEGKKQIISNLLLQKPDLFQEFSPEAMTYPFRTMDKEDVLKSLEVLEPQEFLPMVEKLPQEVMALIATQIDPRVFAQILTKDFKSVIEQCSIG